MIQQAIKICLENCEKPYAINKIRTAYRKANIPHTTMGDRDSKTLLPGFYRPLGASGRGTCPVGCPLLPSKLGGKSPCYAHGGYVILAAQRASEDIEATVASFIACCIVAMRRDNHPGRMFVSGDACREGQPDPLLFDRLCEAADAVAIALGATGVVGYGYSHIRDRAFQEQAARHHIALLRSDYAGPGGAVVWPLTHLRELRERVPGVRFLPCPHYTEGLPCASCSRCSSAVKRGHCVVLHPISRAGKKLKQELLLGVRETFYQEATVA